MSILQEYEEHEEYIGHDKLLAIDEYLEKDSLMGLSYEDVIYCKEQWKKFEEWYNRNHGESSKSN